MTGLKPTIKWDKYKEALQSCQPIKMEGKVVKVAGIVAQANGPGMSVGSLCCIKNASGQNMQAEVIGFNDKRVIVMPFGEMRGIEPGSRIVDINKSPSIKVGEEYLGRVVDGLGNPIDGKGSIQAKADYPIYGNVINPLKREIIHEVIDVGVRSINAMHTLGKGRVNGLLLWRVQVSGKVY